MGEALTGHPAHEAEASPVLEDNAVAGRTLRVGGMELTPAPRVGDAVPGRLNGGRPARTTFGEDSVPGSALC